MDLYFSRLEYVSRVISKDTRSVCLICWSITSDLNFNSVPVFKYGKKSSSQDCKLFHSTPCNFPFLQDRNSDDKYLKDSKDAFCFHREKRALRLLKAKIESCPLLKEYLIEKQYILISADSDTGKER